MTNADTDPLKEIQAMQTVAEALGDLTDDAKRRVLEWAADRFTGGTVKTGGRKGHAKFDSDIESGAGSEEEGEDVHEHRSVADLYTACAPKSDPDRALVVGYWLQFHSGKAEFGSQSVNKELKHLGHGVTNITSAFTSLKDRKPQLVMQTRKSGSSQQARKLYKLTHAGKSAVEAMLKPAQG